MRGFIFADVEILVMSHGVIYANAHFANILLGFVNFIGSSFLKVGVQVLPFS